MLNYFVAEKSMNDWKRLEDVSGCKIKGGISGVDRKQSGRRVQLASCKDIDVTEWSGAWGQRGAVAGGRGA